MTITGFIDPTAAKIVLAAQRGDSINRIAEKIGISYSWVYDWIERLEDKEIISNTDSGIRVTDHELRQRYAEMMAALYSRDTITQEDAYTIPHFAGMKFAFTEIDAAYVWTWGGFQIARGHDDYPVFIEVHDWDVDRWIAFFEQFGISTAINERPDASEIERNVHYVLYPTTEGVDMEWVKGNPVISLARAVEQMLENRPAYEPALEIVAEEHGVDIDAEHHDPPVIN